MIEHFIGMHTAEQSMVHSDIQRLAGNLEKVQSWLFIDLYMIELDVIWIIDTQFSYVPHSTSAEIHQIQIFGGHLDRHHGMLCRMVLQLPYRSSVSEVMHRQLHWLDVVDRVNYKIGLLVYKCLHGLAPGYLSDQCIPASTFAGRANMRSSMSLDRLLYVPRNKTKTLGPRGFYYASSAVWNSLLVDLRDHGLSLHSFRTKLKSHFFIVDWFFSFVISCTLFFSVVLFLRRARQRDVH